uniref:Ig-like domain-containing protein n=1 Tax=Ornithorhynchus anatinus TaxID=9258 RepID=A0A6I8PLP5_ORNAN
PSLAPCILVMVLSGHTHPGRISGPEGGSLTVQCGYDSGWERYVKWWCKGADWNSCKIMVRTTGSEDEQRSDRVSIRDSHRNHMITVTMDSLRAGDADTYWCGIEKAGTDLGAHVVVAINKVNTKQIPSLLPILALFSLNPDPTTLTLLKSTCFWPLILVSFTVDHLVTPSALPGTPSPFTSLRPPLFPSSKPF